MGDFFCLTAADGKVLWQKDPADEYNIQMPIWGIASAPLIDGDLVILQIGGKEACLVAFDKRNGQQRWTALDDRASYSAPDPHRASRQTGPGLLDRRQRRGTRSADWQGLLERALRVSRMVISIATPVLGNDRLFFSSFYDGSLMLKVDRDKPAVEKLWRRHGHDEKHTDSLHAVLSTPYIDGDYIYGVDSHGELRCLAPPTGDRIWESLEAGPQSPLGNDPHGPQWQKPGCSTSWGN